MATVGIDLGTTFSAISHWDEKEQCSRVLEHDITFMSSIPSWVGFSGSNVFVGQEAKNKSGQDIISFFDMKRVIGRDWKDPVLAKEISHSSWPFRLVTPDGAKIRYVVDFKGQSCSMSPEELSMYVLKELKRMAELALGRVSRAVVTVPANFNKSQIEATRNAAELAGLKVLGIIPEPTAAALYYSFTQSEGMDTAEYFLVFDLGGGTLDVTILCRKGSDFRVISTAGDMSLGGEDFDLMLVNWCKQRLGTAAVSASVLRSVCEKAKKDLSTESNTELKFQIGAGSGAYTQTYAITRAEFDTLVNPLLDRIKKPLSEALRLAQVQEELFTLPSRVILVGGSTKIPIVRQVVKSLLGGSSIVTNVPVDTIVSQGAALYAHVLSSGTFTRAFKSVPRIMNVTPLNAGIKMVTGEVSVVIAAQTQYPCERVRFYSTVEHNQEAVNFEVYEGESRRWEENYFVGGFRIENLPRSPPKTLKIPVTFNVNSEGLLTVTAHVEGTNLKKKLVVKVTNNQLSEQEKRDIRKGLVISAVGMRGFEIKTSSRMDDKIQRLIQSCDILLARTQISSVRLSLSGLLEMLRKPQPDWASAMASWDALFSIVHNKPFHVLIRVYRKNCARLITQYQVSRDSASRLQAWSTRLKEIDVNDPTCYGLVIPIIDGIKSCCPGGSPFSKLLRPARKIVSNGLTSNSDSQSSSTILSVTSGVNSWKGQILSQVGLLEPSVIGPQPTTPTASSWTGAVPDFPGIRVIEHIVDSGQASVYRGVHSASTWEVAIKVLSVTSGSAMEAYRAEAETLIRLKHQYVLPIVTVFETPRPCVVTKWMQGGNLQVLLEKRRKIGNLLPWNPTSRQILCNIASGLAYLHQNNVVHRDLKSANIFLDEIGSAVVGDLGFSKAVGADALHITAKQLGSPYWMSPEMIRSNSFSFASDLYAFGIIIWEMNAHKLPYQNVKSRRELEDAVLAGERPKVDSQWPQESIRLMKECWKAEPNMRPSADEVIEILQSPEH